MILKIFKFFFICKITFKSPKTNDLVILDDEGIEFLENILKGRDYFTLVTRSTNLKKVYLTPKIVFYLIFYFKGDLFLAYLSALLKIIKPKIVLTFIDNSDKFHKLAKLFRHDYKFLAIQTAIRDLEIKYNEYFKKRKLNFYDYRKNYYVPYLFCNGQFEIDYFKKKKLKVDTFKKIGSLRVSNFKKKKKLNLINKKKYDICLFADAATNYNNLFQKDGIEEGFAQIIKFAIRFCKEQNKKIIIPMKRYHKNSKTEEINFLRKYLNKNEFNFLIKNSVSKNTKNKYVSYLKIYESRVTLSCVTTMLREALSLKKKIMVCNTLPSSVFDFPMKEFFYIKNPTYAEFEKKLSDILTLSEIKYFDLLGKKRNYLIEDANKVDANVEVNSYLNKFLHKY